MTTSVVNIRPMAMGKRLRELRIARNLSQPKVELDLNGAVSQGALSALESRDSKSSEFAPVLADYYQVSLRWLLTGQGRPEDTDWPFPRVDRSRWDACNDTDRGYVQAAINGALDECEKNRKAAAEVPITGRGLRSMNAPTPAPDQGQTTPAGPNRRPRPAAHKS